MSHMRPALCCPGLSAGGGPQSGARADERGAVRSGSGLPRWRAGRSASSGERPAGGQTGPKDVHGASRAVDIYDAKADAEAVLAALGAPAKVQILRGGVSGGIRAVTACICLGPKKVLGIFGELHPRVLKAMDVKGPPWASPSGPRKSRSRATRPQIAARWNCAICRRSNVISPSSSMRMSRRCTLVNAAAGADKALIDDVRIFDEFIGGSLGEGKKSLAMTVRLQPTEATLKDADIEDRYRPRSSRR